MYVVSFCAFVFFFKHKTAYEMRISDWSSDVCSSDLIAAGSWQYPEASLLHIGAVPLFSGFMYAAVGSYIARVWRIFDFRYSGYPPIWTSYALAAAIYVNFFAHHWLYDVRWFLFAATALLFWRCQVWFRPLHLHRRMPLLVGWGLVALFIWLAENIGTFARAWTYPSQNEDRKSTRLNSSH